MVNNAIPDYAFPSEYGSYLVLNTEATFNEMMQSIGIEELHSFEENGAVVLEADEDAKATEKKVNKVVEWLKARWEDIKGLFDKFLKMIKELVGKAKKKISDLIGSATNKKVVVDMLSRLKHTGKDGKEKIYGKTFEYGEGYEDIISKDHDLWIGLYNIANIGKYGVDDPKKFAANLEDRKQGLARNLKVSDISTKSMQSAVNDIMRGKEIDVTYEYINKNFDDLWNYATNYDVAAKKLGEPLKKIKKGFDTAVSKFKETVTKAQKKDASFKEATKAAKEVAKITSAVSGAICNNVRMRTTDSVRIIMRLCIAVKVKKEKEAKQDTVLHNSALVPGSFQTELASLFNF